MFKIYDYGRNSFFQWDLNRKIVVEDPSITQVHFSNNTEDYALVVEVYESDGVRLANVPNILLQTDWYIRAYGYVNDHTLVEERFKVNARSKPADYVYTETEIINYEALEKRIKETYVAKQEVDTEVDTFSNNPIANFAITRYVEALNTAIISGETTVGRALQDLNGNDITLTYATKTSVIPKISLWQPNTSYEVGNVVLAIDPDGWYYTAVCISEHISSNIDSLFRGDNDYWTITSIKSSESYRALFSDETISASKAYKDGNGNNISNTYATKTELRPTPITDTSSAITANNSYNYGEQTELSITFPTTANDGDVVYITFTSGATATVLTLDTTNTSDIELIPEANTGYEVYAKYNGTIWIVNYSDYTVTAEAGA